MVPREKCARTRGDEALLAQERRQKITVNRASGREPVPVKLHPPTKAPGANGNR